ncbi:hypothetical protein [Spiroplasma ixodetis]|uniref:hypothetical protein n=1 Tax=Spiroplasma ixodetis TaxID=2141 RepID=UPI002578D46B|nr:hypothetical protein [Spiroplasma ixodetis]WJG70897.1 hypothetical protein SIXOD_v1c21850 [Spiroplasma ixodetis Y32]
MGRSPYFKKEIINEYKEKLIDYLNFCIETDNKRLKMEHYNENWIKGSIEQVEIIINVIKSEVFDND